MTDQMFFPGLEPLPAAERNDRLFFGLFLDTGMDQKIGQTARKLRTEQGLSGEPLKAGRFHVTLFHLDDYAGLPAETVAAAREAAATLEIAPFEIVFDRVMSFAGKPGSLPFVLRMAQENAALMELQQLLVLALKKAGVVRKARGNFVPHVTLLYDRLSVGEQAIDPIRWTVDEFVLIHSLLGKTQHIPLGRWPLRG